MSPSLPSSLTAVATRVEECLADLLHSESSRWAELDPELDAPFAEIERLVLAGGKRVRPMLCHLGYVAFGGDPADRRQIEAGAAIEMLHACALLHDDIMDGATSRRGQETAHLRFAGRHRDGMWAGETRRFGEGAALLVGDLAFSLADVLLGEVPPRVRSVWNELRLEVNIGQYLDVLGTARRERRVEVADRICRLKSGKYTIERPLHIGALLARPDLPDKALQSLSRFGLPLGDAFQMQDDLLGVLGDPMVTGKPVGDDLREGKPTPVLARALERADAAQHSVLARVGRDDLTDSDVAEIRDVMIATGAVDEVANLIAGNRDRAVSALAELDIDAGTAAQLRVIADFIVDRRA